VLRQLQLSLTELKALSHLPGFLEITFAFSVTAIAIYLDCVTGALARGATIFLIRWNRTTAHWILAGCSLFFFSHFLFLHFLSIADKTLSSQSTLLRALLFQSAPLPEPSDEEMYVCPASTSLIAARRSEAIRGLTT